MFRGLEVWGYYVFVGFGVQVLWDLSPAQGLQCGVQAPKPDQELGWNLLVSIYDSLEPRTLP